MSPAILELQVEPDFLLRIHYANGERRVLDMRPWLSTGVFRRIAEPCVFATARISFDTVEWMNGVDIDPDFVYVRSVPDPRVSTSAV